MRLTIDHKLYQQYINSPEWRHKRQQALEHHGTMCRGCGTQHNLHVHHRTYQHLGHEHLDDLVILCETCHQGVHQLHDNGIDLDTATQAVIDSTPSEDKRTTPDFVPLNRRSGYTTPHLGGQAGRLHGLPIKRLP